jgi:hypothetical protein
MQLWNYKGLGIDGGRAVSYFEVRSGKSFN